MNRTVHSPSLIEIAGLRKTFAGPPPVVALDDVSLAVREYEFCSIIGPSGCGKSTLLGIVAGLVDFDAGSVTVDGTSPDEARKRRAYSFAFQDSAMLPWRSVRDNVALPLELAGVDRPSRYRTADALIDRVGLTNFAGARPDQLSGGMRQRVALARSLSSNPKLLLMDEPFGALDEITRAQMNLVLLHLLDTEKLTVVMVTHSIEEAVFLSDRVVVMSPHPGRIKQTFPIDLPRPRERALKETAPFFECLSALRQALEFEAQWL